MPINPNMPNMPNIPRGVQGAQQSDKVAGPECASDLSFPGWFKINNDTKITSTANMNSGTAKIRIEDEDGNTMVIEQNKDGASGKEFEEGGELANYGVYSFFISIEKSPEGNTAYPALGTKAGDTTLGDKLLKFFEQNENCDKIGSNFLKVFREAVKRSKPHQSDTQKKAQS